MFRHCKLYSRIFQRDAHQSGPNWDDVTHVQLNFISFGHQVLNELSGTAAQRSTLGKLYFVRLIVLGPQRP